jgi:hypothetical protein
MDRLITPPHNSRLGFHYFPDTLHYRESDLSAWLPEIKSLGASWVILIAPADRAIPEAFLRGLLSAGIEPVLHFHMPLDAPPHIQEMRLLFNTYARWGVHYVILFDRPNTRRAWLASSWAQSNLVERFLDVYLPIAEAALQAGVSPVFPPLEPGGDYWDTTFLRAALQGIQRRGHVQLIDKLILSAYASTCSGSLNWGAGGPERWPSARPYHTPENSQDQRGFRIFDWYLTLAQAVLRKRPPILLLGSGCCPSTHTDPIAIMLDEVAHSQRVISIASLMQNQEDVTEEDKANPEAKILLEPVPPEVVCCNFWLIAAAPDDPASSQAWFQPEGRMLPSVGALRQWFARRESQRSELRLAHSTQEKTLPVKPSQTAPSITPAEKVVPRTSPSAATMAAPTTNPTPVMNSTPATISPPATTFSTFPVSRGPALQTPEHPIAHYLLLPTYEWGIADWHLDVIRPYVKKYRPTIGFSLSEAAQAQVVTVIGGETTFPESSINQLIAAGCVIEQIRGDGTRIATQLETL